MLDNKFRKLLTVLAIFSLGLVVGLYLPKSSSNPSGGVGGFHTGDRVRYVGPVDILVNACKRMTILGLNSYNGQTIIWVLAEDCFISTTNQYIPVSTETFGLGDIEKIEK